MNRSFLASVLAGLSLVQNLAYANIITDLPNPWDGEDVVSAGSTPSTASPAAPPSAPPVAPPSAAPTPEAPRGEEAPRELRVGDRVYYSSRIGVVKAFLSDDKVLLAVDGYYDFAAEKSLVAKSVRCEPSGRLCVNDQVLFSSSVGKVKEAFANGMILLSRDGYYDYLVEGSSLSKAVRCLKSICVNDQVVYSNTSATVKNLFDNRQAVIARPGYYDTVVDVGYLFKRTKCDSKGRICEGQKIAYGGTVGVALQVYSNDQVLLQRSGYYDAFVDVAYVSKAVDCLGDVCVGNRVFYSQTVGTVVGLFANEQVLLRRDGYYDAFVAREHIAKSTRCLPKYGICAGDKVSYYNSMGTAKEVFANGKVLLERSGYYDAFVEASDLKKMK